MTVPTPPQDNVVSLAVAQKRAIDPGVAASLQAAGRQSTQAIDVLESALALAKAGKLCFVGLAMCSLEPRANGPQDDPTNTTTVTHTVWAFDPPVDAHGNVIECNYAAHMAISRLAARATYRLVHAPSDEVDAI